MYTEQINKVAMSSNDDKKFQISDKITTYPYGTNAFNPTKVGGAGGPMDPPPASLFVITWKPLLFKVWCSRTFNQIYMGSH